MDACVESATGAAAARFTNYLLQNIYILYFVRVAANGFDIPL